MTTFSSAMNAFYVPQVKSRVSNAGDQQANQAALSGLLDYRGPTVLLTRSESRPLDVFNRSNRNR